jgi:hypothetical protein
MPMYNANFRSLYMVTYDYGTHGTWCCSAACYNCCTFIKDILNNELTLTQVHFLLLGEKIFSRTH